MTEIDDLTLFDFVAGVYYRSKVSKTPAIVGVQTLHPERDAEAYFFSKLVLHYSWERLTPAADWLVDEDHGSHQRAFERLLDEKMSRDRAGERSKLRMQSLCFPDMNLSLSVGRDLARLQTMLLSIIGERSDGNLAQEQMEGAGRIAQTLRQLRQVEDDEDLLQNLDFLRGGSEAGGTSDSLLSEILGGVEAKEDLIREGYKTLPGKLYQWLTKEILAGGRPRVIIHGPGGCGKSHFVRALVTTLRDANVKVAIGAPTGCAAFLINGGTLHSLLKLPVDNESYGKGNQYDDVLPQGAALANLREFWRQVQVLVIDEISMISAQTWMRIDVRLQLFRGISQPFGGLAMLMLGDLYQLPPPSTGAEPLYADELRWRLFTLVEFQGNHRAAEDPDFADILSRVRVGQHVDADIEKLQTRVFRIPRCATPEQALAEDYHAELLSKGVPMLSFRRSEVFENNERALLSVARTTGAKIYKCAAIDTYAKNGLPSFPDNAHDKADDNGGLETELQVCEGARVMLRSNIDVADGLVNGATGWVEEVMVSDADAGAECVVGIWARMDRGGDRWRSVNGTDAVLIHPIQGQFHGKRDNEKVLRSQFPLVLAWGKTIHKSQGATEQHGVMITLTKRQPGLAYVALSRCKRLADIHWLGKLTADLIVSPDVDCDEASGRILWPKVALKVLRAQQRDLADRMDKLWCEIFKLEELAEDAPSDLAASAKMRALMQANEDEALGRPPRHVCRLCQEGFYLEEALERHQKTAHKELMPKTAKPRRQRAELARDRRGLKGPHRDAPPQKRARVSAKTFKADVAEAQPPSRGLRIPEEPSQQRVHEDGPARRRLREKTSAPLPRQPDLAISPSALFHEKQEGAMCAMHALNNALGEQWQSPADMEFALVHYLAEADIEGLGEAVDDHTAPGGWYSSEVLAYAVRSTTVRRHDRQLYQMSLEPIGVQPYRIHHCLGVVVNEDNRHWVALRSIEGTIWKHDSIKDAPEPLSNAAYLKYLAEHPDAYPIVKNGAWRAERQRRWRPGSRFPDAMPSNRGVSMKKRIC